MAWRLKNLAKVKKKVIALSWGTNQDMMTMLMWRIKLLEWWLWLKYGVLIKWFEKFKVKAQGGSSQDIEGVESPQMINAKKAMLFEEWQVQVAVLIVNLYFLSIACRTINGDAT